MDLLGTLGQISERVASSQNQAPGDGTVRLTSLQD
jgi:hypothetical protein